MRYINPESGLRPAAAIGAAGLAAGIMLAGGTGTVPSQAGVTTSQPSAAAGLNSDRPDAVIIIGSDPGPGQGPKAVVVTGGHPGDPHGPK